MSFNGFFARFLTNRNQETVDQEAGISNQNQVNIVETTTLLQQQQQPQQNQNQNQETTTTAGQVFPYQRQFIILYILTLLFSLSSIIAGAFYGIYSLFILALGFSGSTSFIGLIKLKALKEIYLSEGRSLYRMELEKIDLNQKKIGLFGSIIWIFYSLASMVSSIIGIIYRKVVIVDSTMSSLDPSNTTTLTSSTLATIQVIKSDYIPSIIITSLAIIIYLYLGVYLFGLSKVKNSLAIRQGSICSFMFTSMCLVPLISTIYIELDHDRRIGEFVCILMLGFTYSIYAERIMYLAVGRSFSFKRFRSLI